MKQSINGFDFCFYSCIKINHLRSEHNLISFNTLFTQYAHIDNFFLKKSFWGNETLMLFFVAARTIFHV